MQLRRECEWQRAHIAERNLELVQLTHMTTGAEHLHLVSPSDTNNTFAYVAHMVVPLQHRDCMYSDSHTRRGNLVLNAWAWALQCHIQDMSQG
jgi:hypothetical protein